MKKVQTKKGIVKKPNLPICVPSVTDRFNQIVLDNIPVSVIVIDKKGYITLTNKYFKNFNHEKEYRRRNVFSEEFFIRENLAEEYKKLLKNGGVFRKDNCHEINSRGEDKYFRITAVSYTGADGKIEGVISLAADNTEAVLYRNKLHELNLSLEKRIKEKTKDLNIANEDLNKALELKSIFMADVSHEFRTSLTIMQCSLEFLQKSCGNKEDLELFKNISTEIQRVSTMLSHLSLLNRTDSLESKLFYKKIGLNSTIASICKELKLVADEKKIKIEHMNSNSQVEIVGNKEDVEKMLLNLIRNAINYNKDKGWIKVWVEEASDGVYLKVQDSGIGIPEYEFSNIFERFYRVDKARTRNKHDSGLGLAICKHVAEMHGGHITVASRLGRGSTFTVYLPYDFRKTVFGR